MKKKFLIVESANDESTFKALIKYIQKEKGIDLKNADIENILDVEQKSAEEGSTKGLEDALKGIFRQIPLGNHDRIGIVWDMDSFHSDKDYQTNDRKLYRISQMNKAIKNAIQDLQNYDIVFASEITEVSIFVSIIIEGVQAEIGCYFVHYQGKGEIEYVLKSIKKYPSTLADCVNMKLPECLGLNQEKALREKDYKPLSTL